MFELLKSFTDSTVQCWGCGVFDRLFQVVSAAAAAMYSEMATLALIILCAFIAFYVFYAVMQNLAGGGKDSMYQEYIKPVAINSIVVVALLGMGVMFPRMITTVTLEPVASMTLIYSRTMLNKTAEETETLVPYSPMPMADDGFYRPQLRDRITDLMKTSTTQFQSMIKLGLMIMDKAFTWKALLGIGALIKHIVMLAMGFALVWGFFKLFVQFCFYFVDVIIALTFFAFFFPLGLVFFVFKDSKAADWVKNLGKNIAPGMLQTAIGAIVTLATVVVTYVVIMVLIARFFATNDAGGVELANQIMSGDIFASDLSDDNLATMTLAGIIVLMYVVQFLAGQINQVAQTVIDSFGLKDFAKVDMKGSMGEQLGNDALKISENVLGSFKKTGKIVYEGITGKTPEGEKKEEGKEEKKS